MDPDYLDELYQLCPNIEEIKLIYTMNNKETHFESLLKFKNLTSIDIQELSIIKTIRDKDIIQYLSNLKTNKIISCPTFFTSKKKKN